MAEERGWSTTEKVAAVLTIVTSLGAMELVKWYLTRDGRRAKAKNDRDFQDEVRAYMQRNDFPAQERRITNRASQAVVRVAESTADETQHNDTVSLLNRFPRVADAIKGKFRAKRDRDGERRIDRASRSPSPDDLGQSSGTARRYAESYPLNRRGGDRGDRREDWPLAQGGLPRDEDLPERPHTPQEDHHGNFSSSWKYHGEGWWKHRRTNWLHDPLRRRWRHQSQLRT